MQTSTDRVNPARDAVIKADRARRDADMAEKAVIADLPIPGAYQAFMPTVGAHLIVQLPGETMRCVVLNVIDPDTVVVKIDSVPMAKTHPFRFEDRVGVRRRLRNGRDVWEAQTDRDFVAEQRRIVDARPRAVPVKPAKVGKKPAGKSKGKR